MAATINIFVKMYFLKLFLCDIVLGMLGQNCHLTTFLDRTPSWKSVPVYCQQYKNKPKPFYQTKGSVWFFHLIDVRWYFNTCFNVHVCKLLLFLVISPVFIMWTLCYFSICYWIWMIGYWRQGVILIDLHQSLKSFRDKTCTYIINC